MELSDRQKKSAERKLREQYAEICYYYPQYSIRDLNEDELAHGDAILLLNFAKKKRNEELLELLAVIGAAQDKKSYRKAKSKLESNIRKIERLI